MQVMGRALPRMARARGGFLEGMERIVRALAKPSRIGLAVVAVCAALIVAVAGTGFYIDYRQESAHAEDIARRITKILAEHATRTIEAGIVVGERVAEALAEHGIADTPDQWRHVFGSAAALPQIRSLVVLDMAGHQVATAQGVPDPDLTPADAMRLVVAAREAAGQNAVQRLSPDDNGAAALVITRPVRSDDGTITGVVVLRLDREYFRKFYSSVDVGPQGVIGIVWDDGALLLRTPAPPRWSPTVMRDVITMSSSEPTIRLSAVDGVERMVVADLLPNLPIRVYTGLAEDDYLANWRSDLLFIREIAAGVVLLMAGLGWLLWRAARREERLVGTLEQAIHEKALLFQEIHHRVKNNLQVVSGLVAMQASGTLDPVARGSLEDLVGRIASIGQVHEVLYRYEEADSVSLQSLLGRLSRAIVRYHKAEGRVDLSVDAGNCRLDLRRAIPVALIANEAIANAFKHGFPDGRRGTVTVRCRVIAGHYVLRIADDGVGIAPDAPTKDTLGTRLIRSLATQVLGTCTTTSHHGTLFELRFPE